MTYNYTSITELDKFLYPDNEIFKDLIFKYSSFHMNERIFRDTYNEMKKISIMLCIIFVYQGRVMAVIQVTKILTMMIVTIL